MKWTRLLLERGNPKTEAGRAHERQRRVLLSALASVFSKGLALLSISITVPLTLGYLGMERYGVWASIAGLQAMLAFADFGLGYGLVNALSAAEGEQDSAQGRQAVSGAFYLLAGLSLAGGLLLLALWPFLDWAWVFNVQSQAGREGLDLGVACFLGQFLLGLPLSIGFHGFNALQEGYRGSFYQGLGNIVGLLAIWAAISAEAGLPVLVLASSAGPLLGQGLACLDLYGRRRAELRPSWREAKRASASKLLRQGGLFFVIQVCVTIAFQSDNLVLARILGPEAVTLYSVTQKLFIQVPILISFLLVPLWPAYSEAVARGDVRWVRQTFWRSLKLSFLAHLPVALGLYFGARWILELWLGPAIAPPPMLIASLALWTVFVGLNSPIGVFLNGIGALRFAAVTAVLLAAANISFSILLTRRLGVAGVVLGSLAAQLLFSYLPFMVALPILLRGLGPAKKRRPGGRR